MRLLTKTIKRTRKNTRMCQNPCACAQKITAQRTGSTWILAPGRPSDKDNGLHAPTQLRLARTHGTHDTHETKTKTKRSRSPGYGGRTSRTNSPKPPIQVGFAQTAALEVFVRRAREDANKFSTTGAGHVHGENLVQKLSEITAKSTQNELWGPWP